MENDRRKIELLNALLLSMPGTPVIYYGDEIGMGDNYLSRRPRRRAHADAMVVRPQRRVLAAPIRSGSTCRRSWTRSTASRRSMSRRSSASPASLLNWMQRLIAVREQHRAFGRGTLRFLYPRNRKVLPICASTSDETILCVANLSRIGAGGRARPVALPRRACRSSCSARSAFPPIGDLPYLLTLPAYGFFWFVLADARPSCRAGTRRARAAARIHHPGARATARRRRRRGASGAQLERDVLPHFLPRQRWFAAKDSGDRRARGCADRRASPATRTRLLLPSRRRAARRASAQRYFLPLSALLGRGAAAAGAPMLSFTLAKSAAGRGSARSSTPPRRALRSRPVAAMRAGDAIATRAGGSAPLQRQPALRDRLESRTAPVSSVGVEQSNSLVRSSATGDR